MLPGGDAHFELLPISYHEGDREYLKVTVEWGPTKEMSLGLGPPRGFPLMKMTYGRATNTGLGGVPFISFSKSSDASCYGNGKFRIVDLAWGTDGLPDRLVADFEQECGEHSPAIGRLSVQPGG